MRKYLWNPNLEFVKPYQGNLYIDGAFTNSSDKEKPASKEVLRWMISPNPQRIEKKNENFNVGLNKGVEFLSKDNVIVWLGHASFYIRANFQLEKSSVIRKKLCSR